MSIFWCAKPTRSTNDNSERHVFLYRTHNINITLHADQPYFAVDKISFPFFLWVANYISG